MKNMPIFAVAILLLASVNSATAAQIRFKNFCDGMQLETADSVHFTSTETGACLQGTSVLGFGKVSGNRLRLVVNWQPFTGATDQKKYVLKFPLGKRGKFKEYQQQSGKWVLLNKGTYLAEP